MHRFARARDRAAGDRCQRVEAKGPTVKLTLTGPASRRAIEITEAGLLDGFERVGGRLHRRDRGRRSPW
jgi:hypothetical protein